MRRSYAEKVEEAEELCETMLASAVGSWKDLLRVAVLVVRDGETLRDVFRWKRDL